MKIASKSGGGLSEIRNGLSSSRMYAIVELGWRCIEAPAMRGSLKGINDAERDLLLRICGAHGNRVEGLYSV